jgi:septum formation protein
MFWEIAEDIVLASASPRRRELLTMLGLRFEVIPAERELELDSALAPSEGVKRIALAKAEEVAAKRSREALVIAADTIVVHGGTVFGKPTSVQNARWMLKNLSGASHEVYTAVAVVYGGKTLSECERTVVRFRDLSDGEIAAYLRSGEPFDKAGAYGIQGRGSMFIERIEGDYYNVVGLPICRLTAMLYSFGFTVK